MNLAVVHKSSRSGFSLVEAVLSLGIMSCGFLALVSLLALGMAGSRAAHETRTASGLAATCIEQAKQGMFTSDTFYFDSASQPCSASQAVYVVEETCTNVPDSTGGAGALTRVSVRVAPRSSPNAKLSYVELVPAP